MRLKVCLWASKRGLSESKHTMRVIFPSLLIFSCVPLQQICSARGSWFISSLGYVNCGKYSYLYIITFLSQCNKGKPTAIWQRPRFWHGVQQQGSEQQDKLSIPPTVCRWDKTVLAGPGRGQPRPSERDGRKLMACSAAAHLSSMKNTSKHPKCHSQILKFCEWQSFISVETLKKHPHDTLNYPVFTAFTPQGGEIYNKKRLLKNALHWWWRQDVPFNMRLTY